MGPKDTRLGATVTYPNGKFGNSSIQKCQLERVYVWSLEGTVKTEITRWKASLSVHVGALKINQSSPRWWFQIFFIFHPEKLGKIPILTHIFQNGLVQPPTSHISPAFPQPFAQWSDHAAAKLSFRHSQVQSLKQLGIRLGMWDGETSNWAISHHQFPPQMVVKSMGHPWLFQAVRRLVKYDNLARIYVFFWPKKHPHPRN